MLCVCVFVLDERMILLVLKLGDWLFGNTMSLLEVLVAFVCEKRKMSCQESANSIEDAIIEDAIKMGRSYGSVLLAALRHPTFLTGRPTRCSLL